MFGKKMKTVITVLTALGLSLSVGACSSTSGGVSNESESLTIAKPDGAVGAQNNNPFIADASGVKLGYAYAIYEPVGIVDLVDPSREVVPWLASKIEWSDDYTSVKLTARTDVKWNDGKDFSADDIAFTYQMLIDYPALDNTALGLEKVEENGDAVTLTFESSAFSKLDKVLHKSIVPKHVWEKVDDPTSFKNENPVGTGPYTLKQFSSESVVLTSRNDYWGGGYSCEDAVLHVI